MVQTQEAARHGEGHKETVPPTEKPAHCHATACVGFSMEQRAAHGAESPCPRALSAQSPPACGYQSPCLLRGLLPHRTREMLHVFLKCCNCPKQEFHRSPVDGQLCEPGEMGF